MQITKEYTLTGFIKLSCIWKGQLITRKYQGYTANDAIKHFINYVKLIKN